jgi:hypothetical protein
MMSRATDCGMITLWRVCRMLLGRSDMRCSWRFVWQGAICCCIAVYSFSARGHPALHWRRRGLAKLQPCQPLAAVAAPQLGGLRIILRVAANGTAEKNLGHAQAPAEVLDLPSLSAGGKNKMMLSRPSYDRQLFSCSKSRRWSLAERWIVAVMKSLKLCSVQVPAVCGIPGET